MLIREAATKMRDTTITPNALLALAGGISLAESIGPDEEFYDIGSLIEWHKGHAGLTEEHRVSGKTHQEKYFTESSDWVQTSKREGSRFTPSFNVKKVRSKKTEEESIDKINNKLGKWHI